VHETVFLVLVTVAALHALAALFHHFVRKDDTLRRMLPFVRPRGS
jgi:cytochrome b561